MDELQERTLRLYLALRLVRPTWAGALLLGVGLGQAGRALALATLAAGGAGLFLEDEPDALRQATREGCCTFTVTTLEEAIRALKNEVRQGRAITVAVRGPAAQALAQAERRGLQPASLACNRRLTSEELQPAGTLLTRGASLLCGMGLVCDEAWPRQTAIVPLDQVLHGGLGGWAVASDPAATRLERSAHDRQLGTAAAACRQGVHARLATDWLQAAPSLFPRALVRAYLQPPVDPEL